MRTVLGLVAAMLLATALPSVHGGHPDGSGTRSLGGATVPPQPGLLTLEAEDFARKEVGALETDPEATGGSAWRMDAYGVIGTPVELPSSGIVWIEVRAKGFHAEGLRNPHMHPNLDGEQSGEWDVRDAFDVYRQSVPILAGTHELAVDNFNNYHAEAPDRTLVVDWVRVSRPTVDGVPRVGMSPETVVDAPEIHRAGTGLPQPGDDARNGTQWLMWGVGCFAEAVIFDFPGRYEAVARLRGNERGGVGSHTALRLDGETLDEFHVGDAWMERRTVLEGDAGVHVLEICYDNDFGGAEKRNLWLDDLTLRYVQGDEETEPWEPPAPASAAGSGQAGFSDDEPGGKDGAGRETPGPDLFAVLVAFTASATARIGRRPS